MRRSATVFAGLLVAAGAAPSVVPVGVSASGPALSGYAINSLIEYRGSVYAGTDAGLFASAAGGSWVAARGAMGTAPVHALAILPTGLVAATDSGVARSADGFSWSVVGLAGQRVDSLSVVGGSLVAGTGTQSGTDGMAFRTDDGGDNWLPSSSLPALEGLPGAAVQAVLAPAKGAPALAGTAGRGVYRSVDGRGAWSAGGTGPEWVTAFLRSTTGVLAATDDGLYSSGDAGASWQLAAFPQQDPWVQALSGEAAAALAGTYDGTVYRLGGGGSATLAAGLPSVLSLMSAPGGGVVVGTFDGLFCISCVPGMIAGGQPRGGSRPGSHAAAGGTTAPSRGQRPGAPGATPPFAPEAGRSSFVPASGTSPPLLGVPGASGAEGRLTGVWWLVAALSALAVGVLSIGRRRSRHPP
jgi:hypothetical protein